MGKSKSEAELRIACDVLQTTYESVDDAVKRHFAESLDRRKQSGSQDSIRCDILSSSFTLTILLGVMKVRRHSVPTSANMAMRAKQRVIISECTHRNVIHTTPLCYSATTSHKVYKPKFRHLPPALTQTTMQSADNVVQQMIANG